MWKRRIMLQNQLQDLSILLHRKTSSISIWIWRFVIAKILQQNTKNKIKNQTRDLWLGKKGGKLKDRKRKTVYPMTKIGKTAKNRKSVCLHKKTNSNGKWKIEKKCIEKLCKYRTVSGRQGHVKECVFCVYHVQGYMNFVCTWRSTTTDSV